VRHPDHWASGRPVLHLVGVDYQRSPLRTRATLPRRNEVRIVAKGPISALRGHRRGIVR